MGLLITNLNYFIMKKSIILFAIASVIAWGSYAQKPAIVSLEIGGRTLKGTDAYANSKPLTYVGNGDFVYYGYFYDVNPSITGNGFKISVNRHITAASDWNSAAYTALVAPVAQTPVSAGGNYGCLYVGAGQTDTKWILASDATDGTNPAGEGWFKVTVHTSDLEDVNFDFDSASGSFADLAGILITGGVLTPAFDPSVTTYTCTLPATATKIKPAVFSYYNTAVTGTDEVILDNGTGTSNIAVTALNGTDSKTYTVNYVTSANITEETDLIVNNSFDYVAEGIPYGAETYPDYPGIDPPVSSKDGATWRPVRQNITKIENHLEFYGWQLSDWEWMWKKGIDGTFINADETTANQSIGINAGTSSSNGSCAWIASATAAFMPEDFEFYQIIDKDELSAGTYQLSCLIGIEGGQHHTSQRLFANSNVQFFAKEGNYDVNKTAGEIYSYANHAPAGADNLKAMKVYVTIGADDDLKIGMRSGNADKNGVRAAATSGATRGWFKMDDFRLFKLNPADAANADLASITLSAGTLTFNPATTLYDVELPAETMSVTASAIAALEDVKVTGTGAVDVSSGTGVSNIVVTALDGSTMKTYTINYTLDGGTGISVVSTGNKVKSVQYISLTGTVAPATAKGLLLKKTTYTDGSVKVEKVINK
jgi:hypothetical protein